MSTSTRYAIALGTPQILPVRSLPVGVAVIPGAGGTMLVEYTLSPRDGVGTVTWFPWPKGNVGAASDDALTTPVTAVRISAAGAAGVAEVCE